MASEGTVLVLFNNVGAAYFKEFFDMRGELTDISEAEALELIKELRE